MKQFIVLISTIVLGVVLATFIMGFKTTAKNLNSVATDALSGQNSIINTSIPQ